MGIVQVMGMRSMPNKCQAYPKYRNDGGVSEIRIGAKQFECIGQSPPHDHPHVYLEIGERDEILCPYCNTLFRFDAKLEAANSEPPESLFRPMYVEIRSSP